MFRLKKRNICLLASINLVVLFLVFSDYYFFNPIKKTYVLQAKDAVYNSGQGVKGSSRRSWINYFLISNNEKFEVPYVIYRSSNTGDSFFMSKSSLFKRPLLFEFKQDLSHTVYKIGKLNNITILSALIISIVISFVVLLFDLLNLTDKRGALTSAQILALVLSCINVIIYFV